MTNRGPDVCRLRHAVGDLHHLLIPGERQTVSGALGYRRPQTPRIGQRGQLGLQKPVDEPVNRIENFGGVGGSVGMNGNVNCNGVGHDAHPQSSVYRMHVRLQMGARSPAELIHKISEGLSGAVRPFRFVANIRIPVVGCLRCLGTRARELRRRSTRNLSALPSPLPIRDLLVADPLPVEGISVARR